MLGKYSIYELLTGSLAVLGQGEGPADGLALRLLQRQLDACLVGLATILALCVLYAAVVGIVVLCTERKRGLRGRRY
jgi:hypothetical protein